MGTTRKHRTLAEVESDPRIREVTREYDGKGVHLAECKEGYCFWGDASTSIGNASTIIEDVNCFLTKRDAI